MQPNTSRFMHPLIPALCVLIAAFAWQAGANSSAAASRPPAQPVSVVTVDIVEVIDQLEERKTLEDQLEKRKTQSQKQLEEVQNQLNVIGEDLKMLDRNTDVYKDKVREGLEMRAVVNARGEALNQILSIDRGNMTRELYTKIADAIKRIAEREGYDIVLFDDTLFSVTENAPYQEVFRSIVTKSVIYHHASTDITDQVVNLMNNEYTAP